MNDQITPSAQDKLKPMRFSIGEAEKTWSGPAITKTGLSILITPARPDDQKALKEFFDKVGPDDLYYRFLSGMRHVDDERISAMVRNDDEHSIDFLALDMESGAILATAMLVADANFDTAEFALCTRADMKQRGISWTLLDHAARYAEAMGVRKILSIESFAQRDALQLEREMGFKVTSSPDDASLVLAEKVFWSAA